jgi:hypothetical protein
MIAPARTLACVLAGATLAGATGCHRSEDERPRPTSPAGTSDLTVLQSRPDLRPPVVAVDRSAPDAGGLVFITPRMEEVARDGATHQQGARAVDGRGRTVWFHAAPDGEPITDARVQRYREEPVLTWWQGAASKYGIGRGEGVIVDESYRRVATVQAGNGKTADLHEFLLTDRDTALVTIYSRARRDLRALGGRRDAQVTEGIVQEIDVATGRVLFEWHSLDEVDPSESVQPLPKGAGDSYDYFHINSVAEDADGDLLVSARHTSAIYKIDRETGRLAWRLGGKRSDFALGPGASFGLQHDARPLGGGVLQLFDNGDKADRGRQPASSVKRLRLDEDAMRATLVERFDQPDGLWAESQGNADATGDGGVLTGWGSTGAFSLFARDGGLLFDAHLPAAYDSYRAHLGRWTGRPAAPPAIHVTRDGQQVTVDASWNGATEVRAWQVLAGASPDALQPVGDLAEWADWETTIVRATPAAYVAVAALDASGARLSTSRAVRVPAAG